MHAVTTPDRNKRTRITLEPLEPWKVRRGHADRRGGAGVHQDRRLSRLRTRSASRRVALTEGN